MCDEVGEIGNQYGFNGRLLQNLVMSNGWKRVHGEGGCKLGDRVEFDHT
jgi:hypothetical protein